MRYFCSALAALTLVGVALAIALGSVVDALRIFYTLLTVSFFVPILAGLYAPHATTLEAGTSIACGIIATVVTQFATAGRGIAGLTADVIGVAAALVGFAIVYLSRLTLYGSTRTL